MKRVHFFQIKKQLVNCGILMTVLSSAMLLLQSCGIDAGSIARKTISQVEKESMEAYAETADYDEGLPAGDLFRLNYARSQARLKASETITEKLNMDDEKEVYTTEQEIRRSELIESALSEIDGYYDPLIAKELQLIEGNNIPCFETDGITDVDAKIEHVDGTRHICVRLEGTLTRKGSYLHYKIYSPIFPGTYSTGAANLLNTDKSVKRFLKLPGERVYCYIILDQPAEQAVTAVEVTRIND